MKNILGNKLKPFKISQTDHRLKRTLKKYIFKTIPLFHVHFKFIHLIFLWLVKDFLSSPVVQGLTCKKFYFSRLNLFFYRYLEISILRQAWRQRWSWWCNSRRYFRWFTTLFLTCFFFLEYQDTRNTFFIFQLLLFMPTYSKMKNEEDALPVSVNLISNVHLKGLY